MTVHLRNLLIDVLHSKKTKTEARHEAEEKHKIPHHAFEALYERITAKVGTGEEAMAKKMEVLSKYIDEAIKEHMEHYGGKLFH